MASTAINGLQVKGEAAPLTTSCPSMPTSADTVRLTRRLPGSHSACPFVFKQQTPSEELTITGLSGPTVPVRKMAHLTRIRTANFGISTMDSNYIPSESPHAFVIEKPHFVLCGLPVGSKEIDHHLYVSETRVGSYKTSAKAMYQARRGLRSGKAASEPPFSSPEKHLINNETNLPEAEDTVTQRTIPPIPPTTPVNYAHYLANMKPRTAINRVNVDFKEFHGSIPSAEGEGTYVPPNMVKHKKLTLLNRDRAEIEMQREHSSVSTQSIRSMETVSESVVNNSLTVTTGKGAKLVNKSNGQSLVKINYNNPYRNKKYRERMALIGNQRIEFDSIDSYFKHQKRQHINGKHFMTPRAILKVPKPCSDTFLLQMMYDLNRPMSRKSVSDKFSDVTRTKDLEEFVQARTSSSLSKTQSNIDKFMNKPHQNGARSLKSGKSAKSVKSAKSAVTDAIEEEKTAREDDEEIDEEIPR